MVSLFSFFPSFSEKRRAKRFSRVLYHGRHLSPAARQLSQAIPDSPPKRCILRPNTLSTLHFSLLPFSLARHRLVFLSVFRPPPLLLRGEEEERPGVEEKKRLWCKLSQYRASIDAPLQSGNCSAVWCRADLLQHPRPLPLTRRLQSLAGFPRAPGERQRKEKGGAS